MRIALTGLILLLSVWLSACTTVAPFGTDVVCHAIGDSTVRLKIQRDGQVQYLLLRTEPSAEQTVFVALDSIGSPQFSATLKQGQLQLQRSPLYRGTDPAALVWGYYWWSLADTARAHCVNSADLTLQQNADSINLLHKGRLSWHWDARQAQQFVLPRQGSRISVTPLKR